MKLFLFAVVSHGGFAFQNFRQFFCLLISPQSKPVSYHLYELNTIEITVKCVLKNTKIC